MTAETEVASLLRGELAKIIACWFFLLIGLIAFLITFIRRRGSVRILIWVGLRSG